MGIEKILGIRVNTKGMQTALLHIEDNQIQNIDFDYFNTPIIYNFSDDISKILKWHRNHLITTIHSNNIKYISIKRIERNSFMGRPKDNDIQRMYLEGMVLSLAGEYNLINDSYYKTSLNKILNSPNYEDKCRDLNQGTINDLQIDSFAVAFALAKNNEVLNDN